MDNSKGHNPEMSIIDPILDRHTVKDVLVAKQQYSYDTKTKLTVYYLR